MIGICELKDVLFLIIENCKIYCLCNLRCFGVEYIVFVFYVYCILYMYKVIIFRCFFLRRVFYFFYKGNYIVSNFIKFLFYVLNYVFVRKDVWRFLFEFIIYKVEKYVEFNILIVIYRYM